MAIINTFHKCLDSPYLLRGLRRPTRIVELLAKAGDRLDGAVNIHTERAGRSGPISSSSATRRCSAASGRWSTPRVTASSACAACSWPARTCTSAPASSTPDSSASLNRHTAAQAVSRRSRRELLGIRQADPGIAWAVEWSQRGRPIVHRPVPPTAAAFSTPEGNLGTEINRDGIPLPTLRWPTPGSQRNLLPVLQESPRRVCYARRTTACGCGECATLVQREENRSNTGRRLFCWPQCYRSHSMYRFYFSLSDKNQASYERAVGREPLGMTPRLLSCRWRQSSSCPSLGSLITMDSLPSRPVAMDYLPLGYQG